MYAALGEFETPINGPANPLEVPLTTTLSPSKLYPAPIDKLAVCAVVPVLYGAHPYSKVSSL